MNNLTPENRSLVMAEVRMQRYSARFRSEEIDRALASAVHIFSDFEQRFVSGFCAVILQFGKVQRPADFATELIPALVYAHRHFGDSLPKELRQKLINQPQTHDTIFELMCLGAFLPHHLVRYEPTLADGKVPDLLLSLPSKQEVYVECKSQGLFGSDHERRFSKATGRIHSILDPCSSKFVKNAWEKGLRSEIRLSHTPSDIELTEFEKALDGLAPSCGERPTVFGTAISLSLVSRNEPFDETEPHPSAVINVGTTPTSLHYTNVYAAVYPWKGLDTIRRRSQRRLLANARGKFAALQPTARGIICIQTFESKKFAPDISKLIQQGEFERIPIVWLNPVGIGTVICRNDAIALRDQVFGPVFMAAQENA